MKFIVVYVNLIKRYKRNAINVLTLFNTGKQLTWVISGFHRALLQSITFINRLNALNYTKRRG